MKGLEGKRHERKKAIVAQFGGKCQRCGYDRCLRALQFHHVDSSEKDIWSTNESKRGRVSHAEVEAHPERFLLLCANCHFEEHDRIDRESKPRVICQYCGEVFATEQNQIKEGKANYCSTDCKYKNNHKVAIAGIPDRLRRQVQESGECLIWTGYCHGNTPVMTCPVGYNDNMPRTAAKVLWEIERGPLPEGIEVWRTCETPRCIRPEHQTIGTKTMMQRAAGLARRIATQDRKKIQEIGGELLF
jgi:hypothetical protein